MAPTVNHVGGLNTTTSFSASNATGLTQRHPHRLYGEDTPSASADNNRTTVRVSVPQYRPFNHTAADHATSDDYSSDGVLQNRQLGAVFGGTMVANTAIGAGDCCCRNLQNLMANDRPANT